MTAAGTSLPRRGTARVHDFESGGKLSIVNHINSVSTLWILVSQPDMDFAPWNFSRFSAISGATAAQLNVNLGAKFLIDGAAFEGTLKPEKRRSPRKRFYLIVACRVPAEPKRV